MIEKILLWTIRSVNTQKSFERLMDLDRRYHYSFITLMEPFQNSLELYQYKWKLGFEHAGVNYFGEIWFFWNDDWEARRRFQRHF